MCGIAGIVRLDGQVTDKDIADVVEMTRVLRHRGPDSWAIGRGHKFAFGASRLRIMDLTERSDQPFSLPDRSLSIVYNGQITNFRELAADHDLEDRLQTGADTEVLLRLYERLGNDCWALLSGYFACAIFDRKSNKVVLARDAFGVRPMFVYERHSQVYFASEIKCLLALSEVPRELDVEAFFHYFTLAYMPGPHTPFQSIKEFPAGTIREFDLRTGRYVEKMFFTPFLSPDEDMVLEEAEQIVETAVVDSVRRNLICDSPLGFMLSGGIDTSALVGIARALNPQKTLHTFSIAMAEKSFDERRYQRDVAKYNNTCHHEIRVGPADVLDALEKHLAFLDEPNADGANIPFFLLAEYASQHVRVLVSGEGGDEMFNAYETHGAQKVKQIYEKLPQWSQRLLRAATEKLPVSHKKLSWDFVLKRFTEGAILHPAEAHIFFRHTIHDRQKELLFRGASDFEPTSAHFKSLYDASQLSERLQKLSWLDWEYYFRDDLMTKGDRMLMAHSIESRVPYADKNLFEAVKAIPMKHRLVCLRRRYVQKIALNRYLPDSVRRRGNMGLEMPHSSWFFLTPSPEIEQWFSEDSLEGIDFLNKQAIDSMLEQHRRRHVDLGRALWSILIVVVWHRLFVKSSGYRKYISPWAGSAVIYPL